MRLGKMVLIVAACAFLLIGSVGASLLPSGAMAQAGPLLSPLPTVAPPTGNTCVARATVNIRRGPSTRYRIVGRLPRGGKITKTKVQGSWLYGTSAYGTGWVLKSLVRCG